MPTFFPQNSIRPGKPLRTWKCRAALLVVACTMQCCVAPAQTLARPGWAGSGLAPETWYQRAVFYRIDTSADMPTRAQLPSLQAFGVDAIVLTAGDLVPTQADAPQSAAVAIEDGPLSLDDLFFECSRLHMRVVVPLDLAKDSSAVLALARSWLYRGAAGFVVSSAASTADAAPADAAGDRSASAVHPIHLGRATPDAPIVAALHALLAGFPGNRILIADGATLTASFQLQVAALSGGASAPMPPARALLTSAPGQALTAIEAARLLATPYPALLESAALPPPLLARVFPPLSTPVEPVAPPVSQPAPPSNVYGTYKPYVPKDLAAEKRAEQAAKEAQEDADRIAADTFPVQPMYEGLGATPEARAAFYHRLVQLHRARTSRPGSGITALSVAAPVFAWSVTHAGAAPLVIVCNPASAAQRLDLHTRLTYRTLLHTAAASGVERASDISVGPQGVYIGQALSGKE